MSPWFSPTAFHDLVSGQRRGWLAAVVRALLRFAELPYRSAVRYRNWRYDRDATRVHSVSVPVLSVGNITVGGTGKTPLVAWLARWFQHSDVRVGLVSRGYKANDGEPNDEALELEQRLPGVPHLQDPDRVRAAQRAITEHGCQLLVLDDAFQHRRIHRNLDIVLIDALQPFGYGHVLPRGLLREPLSQLARADIVALSRAEAVTVERRRELQHQIRSFAPQATWVEIVHQPQEWVNADRLTCCLEELAGKQIAAFSGIGNPDGFLHSLLSVGCQVVDFRKFPDHHAYGPQDKLSLEQWLDQLPQIEAVVCSCKDLVKIDLCQIGRHPLWALAIDIDVISGRSEFESRLQSLLDAVRSNNAGFDGAERPDR